LVDEIQDIWQLASKLHDGQKYGGPNQGEKVEYINHIGSVVFEILNAARYTDDMDLGLAVKCAILHDTIEDTPFTYEKVHELFGIEVAAGVQALTKSDAIKGKLEKMYDSLRRIKSQPKEIWAVKLADRISNLFAPPYYWSDDKKMEYVKESEIILTELKEGNHYLAERLKTKIKEYHRFLNIQTD
jgi:(p)ppGpp synthase/HD superfamily hydrolase